MSYDFYQTTTGKALKTAIWVAVSAVVGYLLALAQGNPSLWGAYTPFVNVILVTLKNLADPKVRNI